MEILKAVSRGSVDRVTGRAHEEDCQVPQEA
jgi:hypothetical protein